MPALSDQELLRYSRQIMLPEIDIAGQERLRGAHCVVMGLGGLGSPVAVYLAAAGIGKLTLVDPDVVDDSNLQRQIVHREAGIGQAKTESAAQALQALRSDLELTLVSSAPHERELRGLFAGADVVADGTDRFSSRYAINRACWASGTPLVSGAAIRWSGQVAVFDPQIVDAPCYQCLHPDEGAQLDAAMNCAENGVIAPLVGVIGALQAMEVIKLLTGVGPPRSARCPVTLYDAKYGEWQTVTLTRNPACPVCAAGAIA
ncbi:MAG: molybdopterin-synthase adenylyltransferase MoeB [Pseudomonadota bacterium]